MRDFFFLVCGKLGASVDEMAKHCVARVPAQLVVGSWTVELTDAVLALVDCIGFSYSKSETVPESWGFFWRWRFQDA